MLSSDYIIFIYVNKDFFEESIICSDSFESLTVPAPWKHRDHQVGLWTDRGRFHVIGDAKSKQKTSGSKDEDFRLVHPR